MFMLVEKKSLITKSKMLLILQAYVDFNISLKMISVRMLELLPSYAYDIANTES